MSSGALGISRFKRVFAMTMMGAWRLFPQRSSSRALMVQNTKLVERRMALEDRMKEAIRLKEHLHKKNKRKDLDKKMKRTKKSRQSRPQNPDSSQASEQTPSPAKSPTSEWISKYNSLPILVPKQISDCSIQPTPSEPQGGRKPPPVSLRKRPEEERQAVEVVLTTPIPLLALFVTPEMMKMIKKSPFVPVGEDVVVLQSDKKRLWVQNQRECYMMLTRLLRNVASEIVYREERMAADNEMRHMREEKSMEDSSE